MFSAVSTWANATTSDLGRLYAGRRGIRVVARRLPMADRNPIARGPNILRLERPERRILTRTDNTTAAAGSSGWRGRRAMRSGVRVLQALRRRHGPAASAVGSLAI